MTFPRSYAALMSFASMPRYRYRASSARVRVNPSIEFLENRCVPSVAPVWVPQGPGPTTQGEVQGMPLQNNPVTGAINSFALDATNANIAFAGAASGGIWRTFNAQSLVPSWTPLTDSMPTLSIGDIAFCPLDANTLYAGTGSFSNGSFGTFAGVANGGDGLGVLKTTDLGNHWTLYSTIVDPVTGQTTTFQDQNLKIRSIVPTEQVGPQGQIVLAGAVSENDDGGVYLSQDGGQTWERLSNTGSGISASGLPNGDVLSIVADPANPSLIYAAVPGDRNMMNPDAGIYRSLDGGLTWTALSVSTALLGDIQAADNVKLAIHNDAANDVVYALVGTIGTNKTAEESVYQSANTGGTWVLMGSNFSGQTSLPQLDTDPQTSNNLTIAADPFLATRVFVAGSGTGEVHYGDFDPQTQNTTWSLASGSGANGNPPGGTPQPTVVHSDSRTMKFDAAGNLWESDDGGVYRLVNPDATSSDQRYWVSENGNIQAAEFYAADYDSVNHTVFAGAQDNGADLQLVPNGVSWLMTFFADSTHVAVDNTSLASSGDTYLYAVNSNLSDMRRFTVDSNNNIIDDCLVGLGTQESSMGCVPLSEKGSPPSPEYLGGLNNVDQNASGAFVPFVLNATDPRLPRDWSQRAVRERGHRRQHAWGCHHQHYPGHGQWRIHGAGVRRHGGRSGRCRRALRRHRGRRTVPADFGDRHRPNASDVLPGQVSHSEHRARSRELADRLRCRRGQPFVDDHDRRDELDGHLRRLAVAGKQAAHRRGIPAAGRHWPRLRPGGRSGRHPARRWCIPYLARQHDHTSLGPRWPGAAQRPGAGPALRRDRRRARRWHLWSWSMDDP